MEGAFHIKRSKFPNGWELMFAHIWQRPGGCPEKM